MHAKECCLCIAAIIIRQVDGGVMRLLSLERGTKEFSSEGLKGCV